MPYDRHLIAPIDKGLQTARKPFLIPENAFSKLHNAYVYRDRVVKRFGGSWLTPTNPVDTPERRHLQSRLRFYVGDTDNNGNIDNTQVGSTIPGVPYEPGCCFSIGDVIFTVDALGTPRNMIRTDGINATQNFNTTTGAFDITQAPANTATYFYPALPVMGLKTYEQEAINDEFSIAFDTKFAYRYGANGWERLGSEEWSGTSSDFFWAANYRGQNPYDRILYVTNNVNPVRYWNGTTWSGLTPVVNSSNGNTLQAALIVIQFKGRLLVFNTREGGNRFRNRCRFSQVGNPATDVNAWDENLVGRGGYIDAPINQAITSVAFLKDRLLVSFERRYLELAYTGNQVLPFVWQEINSELGVESTFSTIEFDNSVLGIADVGVHACVGTGVQRIDQDIPDYIFEIHNQNEGVNRVHGIREFFTEMAYWTLPKENRDAQTPWPNRVLGYNYINRTWSTHDDSITTFGYFQPDESLRWESASETWQITNDTWSSGQLQANIRKVVAGNQTGYTFTVEPEVSRNSAVLLITDIDESVGFYPEFQVENHNLQEGDYILIENIRDGEGPTNLNGEIVEVDNVTDENRFNCQVPTPVVDDYLGGGTITRVSRVDIETKDYNFYLKEGIQSYLQKVEFLVSNTEDGELQVDFSTNTSNLSLSNQADDTESSLGDYTLDMFPYDDIYPYEESQDLLWHPVYVQADGSFFKLRLYYNDQQMVLNQIALQDFRLHAMIFYTKPTSLRMG